jgi:two-component sensor histidine kinase
MPGRPGIPEEVLALLQEILRTVARQRVLWLVQQMIQELLHQKIRDHRLSVRHFFRRLAVSLEECQRVFSAGFRLGTQVPEVFVLGPVVGEPVFLTVSLDHQYLTFNTPRRPVLLLRY